MDRDKNVKTARASISAQRLYVPSHYLRIRKEDERHQYGCKNSGGRWPYHIELNRNNNGTLCRREENMSRGMLVFKSGKRPHDEAEGHYDATESRAARVSRT